MPGFQNLTRKMVDRMSAMSDTGSTDELDGPYAWRRLMAALALSSVGGVGLWSVVVVLPTIETEFGIDRGSASMPYFATMLGAAIGGVLMGRLADRYGIRVPILIAIYMLAVGYIAAASATQFWQFLLAQGLFIGALGSSVTFAPLVADTSLWFNRRRGIAISIVASGNYLAGTIWPPLLTWGMATVGWRFSYMAIACVCVLVMLPLSQVLARRSPTEDMPNPRGANGDDGRARLAPGTVQVLLIVAGIACCMAMAMPQVHIVAYCGDLGYSVARGAEMLSLMLGLGIVSRLLSGVIADWLGGVKTLILGSTLQCLALVFYIPFDGLTSLYIVSALFGLSQGGIVPSYAVIVREYFPARQAGARVSLVMMFTVVGMAVGGWLSGEIFDWTGSYQAAFLHGIAWNLLNMGIAFFLLFGRPRARVPAAAPAAATA